MRSWILICKAVHIYIEGYDQKIILTDGVRMIMSMIQYIPQQEKYLIWIIKDAFGQRRRIWIRFEWWLLMIIRSSGRW